MLANRALRVRLVSITPTALCRALTAPFEGPVPSLLDRLPAMKAIPQQPCYARSFFRFSQFHL